MEQAVGNIEQIESLDYASIRDAFSEELSRAANGEATSLPFIHNTLPTEPLVKPNEIFQAFVIGGTNGEVATVRYNIDGGISVIDHRAHPELAKFRTSEDFLSFIDSNVTNDTRAIGISLAAELIPVLGSHGQLDGILNEGETKGHGFHGLQQERVGATIEHHFQQTHGRKLIASVGNDTVTLAAAAAARNVDRYTLVAGIVGTGYNLAFYLNEHTIINVQASDFANFIPTATGKLVDQQSTNPGKQLYDKEVAKLVAHYNALVDTIGLRGGLIQTGKELADLATSGQDKERDVARALFQRSASLVAAQFAGLYNFKGKPKILKATMQGSLFWEGPGYKDMVTVELLQLGVPSGAIVYERLELADILGAAKLITGGI